MHSKRRLSKVAGEYCMGTQIYINLDLAIPILWAPPSTATISSIYELTGIREVGIPVHIFPTFIKTDSLDKDRLPSVALGLRKKKPSTISYVIFDGESIYGIHKSSK